MKDFKQIDKYVTHSFYKTNYNDKNLGLILQLNINGVLINRCILGIRTDQPFIRFKCNKYAVDIKTINLLTPQTN